MIKKILKQLLLILLVVVIQRSLYYRVLVGTSFDISPASADSFLIHVYDGTPNGTVYIDIPKFVRFYSNGKPIVFCNTISSVDTSTNLDSKGELFFTVGLSCKFVDKTFSGILSSNLTVDVTE
ncbi:hypothetical protein DEFDS_P051 (plasmid) [Deferribacter desulfuricans SSM1]|uniref:Uncharacterized protein n=1 Tax=Deferribacter desulfuricans (strain DSM 14783 / JCM 11476 / NBRC 101012 / SSM1) TaxID=639282 RepID=D3PEN3_DEFDS|nr:hypothetical protein [Deferribacter desulfuricans]BAI81675.1 hypothetical protein DEFDS_P051 [Deferribacter desulfuricans SSM1]